MTHRIAVVGSGYVGTVVAACFAHLGNAVVALEVDPLKVATLSRGTVPFYEPGLGALLTAAQSSRRLRFTDSYADAIENSDVVFICVGTPPRDDGKPDLTYIRSVAQSLALTIQHHPA